MMVVSLEEILPNCWMRSFGKISAIENMADKTFRPVLTYADEHILIMAQRE